MVDTNGLLYENIIEIKKKKVIAYFVLTFIMAQYDR